MFIDNLEKTLKEKNLTLNKLAKGIGIAQSPTSRWKKGTLPSVDALMKICKYLDVSADYLLDLEPEAPPPKLSQEENALIQFYRKADNRGKETILDAASREADRAAPLQKSLNSKIG